MKRDTFVAECLKNITVGSKNPYGVTNAVFYSSLSFSCMLL